jgi:hypothetical protein
MIVRKRVFDLKSFDDVSLGLELTPTPAFTSLQEALAFYNNDESAVLKALNEDKLQREVEAAQDRPISDFRSFEDEEETKLNGPADILPVNEKLVSELVLNVAKNSFGFARGTGTEKNRAAKAAALEFIRKSDALKNYLVAMSTLGPASTTEPTTGK